LSTPAEINLDTMKSSSTHIFIMSNSVIRFFWEIINYFWYEFFREV